jgi:integrase
MFRFMTFLTDLYPNPSTANMVIRACKTFFNMFDFHNHATKLKPLKEPKTEVRIVSPEEYEKLLGVASEKMRQIITFFWKTGCRSGEVSRIKWNDINFKTQTMRINGKGRERIVFIAHMLELLDEIPRGKSGFVFENQYGKQTDPRSFAQLMSRCSVKAAIKPKIRPQHFRQTAATRLLKGGASELVIRAQLGHVKIDTTEKHYLDIDDEMKKSAMSILN